MTMITNAMPVDLMEIFLNKVLKEIGLGLRVHFFYENSKDFFICTEEKRMVMAVRRRQNCCNHIGDIMSEMVLSMPGCGACGWSH